MKKHYFILFLLNYSLAFADGSNALKHFLSANKPTIAANFSQMVTSQKGGKTITKLSYGEMQIKRPGKFNWVYRDAPTSGNIEQRIVSDGKNIYIYDVALQQVTTKKLDKAVTGSPAAILAGGNDLHKYYTIKDLPDTKDMFEVELLPKSADDSSTMQDVVLGFNKVNNQVQYMKLIDAFGNISQLHFTQVKTGVKLASDTFKFIIPAGVDVN